MSVQSVQSKALATRRASTYAPQVPTPWVRNPAWPLLNEPASNEQKLVGLYAVFPGDGGGIGPNFFAVSCAGNYSVDLGDGTTSTALSNAPVEYEYQFDNASLYDATVTFAASTSTVTRNGHGYADGDTVQFYRIVTTTGITEGQFYYVINATTNTFQVAATVGGAVLALTNDGSAALLPYKIATVVITPWVGNNLTGINLGIRHTQTGLQAYSTGWLEIALAGPNLTSIAIGSASTPSRILESVNIISTGSLTSFASLFLNCSQLQFVRINAPAGLSSTSNMFSGCSALVSAPLFNTTSVTNMGSMFTGCSSLVDVPPFDTRAAFFMNSMFSNCFALVSVPLFNTAGVSAMNSMFSSCFRLVGVPLFRTNSVTSMASMFSNCSALVDVPLFDTASVGSMASMFNNCRSLKSVPQFNTSAVTTMNSMFAGCSALVDAPLFNTASVTDMTSMFSGCTALKMVPLLNTSAVQNTSFMFSNCESLEAVPLFNLASATALTSMFASCRSLMGVPLFNTASATNVSSIFSACPSLATVPALNFASSTSNVSAFANCSSLYRVQAFGHRSGFSVGNCKLSKIALQEIFSNLLSAGAQPQTIIITGNHGNDTAQTRVASTTARSTTISSISTSNLAVGMIMTGAGSGISSGITVSTDVNSDTVTAINHGLPDGTVVAFSSIGITSGISVWTPYYVINSTANTFQVSLVAGGAAINLTGGNAGSINLRYPNYIAQITSGSSITLSTPAATSVTSSNLSFRNLDTALALLRNWAITF